MTTDLDETAAIALAVLTAASALSALLTHALPALRRAAERTETRADDTVVGWLGGLAGALGVLVALLRLVPLLRLGSPPPPEREDDDDAA